MRALKIIPLVCYFLSFFLIGFVYCTRSYFGSISFDQLLFVFWMDATGTLSVDNKIITLYVTYCLLLPLLLSFLITYFVFIMRIMIRLFNRLAKLYLSLEIDSLHLIVPFIFLILSISFLARELKIHKVMMTWLKSNQEDYFKQHYAPLTKIALAAVKKPQNLLLIYVESLEAGYRDQHIFELNMLHALRPWEARGVSFHDFHQVENTGWTLAGIIASQCGLPLKFNNNYLPTALNAFLPNATCLSDVLSKAGYYNVFMKGASLNFSGIQKFLQSHHFDEMYGKDEWLKRGYSQKTMNGWGLYDEDLFKEAKKILARLYKKNQPFSLTVLTVDLHGPYGLMGPSCKQVGLDSFQSLVTCQGSMLANFLQDIEKAGWLKNMNVVIMGDHLAMQNPVARKLRRASPRSIYNLILPVDAVIKHRDRVNHFAWLPTILTLLDFEIPEGHAGLQVSAITKVGKTGPPSLSDPLWEQELPPNWLMPSKSYQALWG